MKLCVLSFAIVWLTTTANAHIPSNSIISPGNSTLAWHPIAPTLAPHKDLGVVAFKGEIFALGGYSDKVGAYSPTTNTWRAEPSIPYVFGAGAAVVLDDLIYIMGGCGDGWCATTSTF